MIKVFVYGTLLSEEPNNILLSSSKFLGEDSVEGFQMFNLGMFPACVPVSENFTGYATIVGEVWEVDDETLKRLDYLEGYPNFYDRKEVETSFGKALIYFTPRQGDWLPDAPTIANGDWKKRYDA